MKHLTISGAYGRDYRSKDAAIKDWNDNKDFCVGSGGGPYVGKSQSEQLKNDGYSMVRIRYNKLRSFVDVPLHKPECDGIFGRRDPEGANLPCGGC